MLQFSSRSAETVGSKSVTSLFLSDHGLHSHSLERPRSPVARNFLIILFWRCNEELGIISISTWRAHGIPKAHRKSKLLRAFSLSSSRRGGGRNSPPPDVSGSFSRDRFEQQRASLRVVARSIYATIFQ